MEEGRAGPMSSSEEEEASSWGLVVVPFVGGALGFVEESSSSACMRLAEVPFVLIFVLWLVGFSPSLSSAKRNCRSEMVVSDFGIKKGGAIIWNE